MPTINSTRIATRFAALILLALAATAAQATPPPTPTPTPPLNAIKIGQCASPAQLDSWLAIEREKGNLLDARPFAINQSTGKLSFSGSTGRFTLAHMNPFVYNYRVTVAQKELINNAISDFAKLVLPPSLSSLPGLQSGRLGVAGTSLATPVRLAQIADRLDGLKPVECKSSADPTNTKTPACIATGSMYETFYAMRRSGLLGPAPAGAPYAGAFASITSSNLPPSAARLLVAPAAAPTPAPQAYAEYVRKIAALRNEEADAYTTCVAATDLNTALAGYNFDAYLAGLDAAGEAVSQVSSMAQDLTQIATAFDQDTDLKDAKPVIRCKGYKCSEQFKSYATEALNLLRVYSDEIAALRNNATEMQNMLNLTEKMKAKEGLFARTETVIKKFELTEASIAVNRVRVEDDQRTQSAQRQQSGSAGGSSTGGGRNVRGGSRDPQPQTGSAPGDGSAPADGNGNDGNDQTADGNQADDEAPAQGNGNENGNGDGNGAGNNLAPAGQINEVIQIGQPRFAVSGGLVYSPLARRTFESVKGFALDAQGNPTGDGSADVVGFGENSSRRVLPMVLLNTRLTDMRPVNLYFSWGVSAKNDGNFDIDYLFGPSVSFLKDRAFFTFGAYGGQTQNLVPDVAVGDALPDTIGDAKLYRKNMTWKPGFSFSYNLSRTTPRTVESGTTSSSSTPAADLRNEIRIGSIPFNLAVGLVYTSLEQRTYDEVVGFARNRRGELTNGQTLTRIVGLTSSSDYRLTPAVMLHSRLTKFGRHDFYFTTGVTGKKTDNNFDIEYLIGGSVNLYRRKVFLTVGGFAGKQQLLGGDFFEGAALAKSQSVTTQDRYVWKPAFSFSYDISKIVKRAAQ